MWDSQHIIYALAVIAAIALPFVIRSRRRSQQRFMAAYSDEEVCEHLRPALEHLTSRGHVVRRAGQKAPDFPLEIHLSPPFDPKQVAEELKLAEPVFVSERNVLYCKEDLCELHPVKG
jgi:beta-glucosidase-like glycosyl hydrolase